MSNQEAIEWLDVIKRKGVEFDDNSEETKDLRERAIKCSEEALYMGIQALKNQKYLIDELEKIRWEFYHRLIKSGFDYYVNLTEINEVLNKHIGELK